MKKNLGIRLIVIVATLVVFVVGIIFGPPSNWGSSKDALRKGGFKAALLNNIHLGLDLRGGTHLILQVMVDEAVGAETDNTVEQLKAEFAKENIQVGELAKDPNRQDRIVIKGAANSPQLGAIRDYVSSSLGSEYDSSSSGDDLVLDLKPSYANDIKKRAVEQAIETIRGRVDTLGVSEPVIEEHGLGDYQILVQLPGVDDPARVKDIIQSTARLELKHEFGGPYTSEADALQAAQAMDGGLTDKVVLPGKSSSGEQAFYVVARASVVSGADVRDAQPGRDQNGEPEVRFSLTQRAADKFSKFTAEEAAKSPQGSLAAVLDNRVIEVATVRSEIHDEGNISGGSMSEEAASDLALKLRSGALPASMRQLEDRVVGASLGADSIRQGVTAAVVGMLAVVLFMLIYYRGAGINADLALFLNLVILLGFLGFSGATLTLPGIAGVILTIGMGVDSNVLIFERVREELRHGKAPASAVDQGFAHAWVTIVDTHITTIVSALILFLFGSGPVKGFAITLAFGLFANLFTAVFVSRTIFDWLLSKKRPGEALSI